MLNAVESYLALRRATGFAMQNAEYLLKSFAAFAAERGQSHVHIRTAIDWATLGPSVAQRDALAWRARSSGNTLRFDPSVLDVVRVLGDLLDDLRAPCR